MKRLRLALLCAACLPPAASFTACTTAPTERVVAYRSLASVAYSVDAAMKVYARAVVAGEVDEASQQRVRALHERYRNALEAAVRLASLDDSALAPQELASLAAELTTLIAALTTHPL
ncbi:MAG: hypothetical protein D6781_10650 [Verrucomicrobia bacterium]|nr:MAG: hypothetical protein D6781_10650 [Verrucomicrobiota bacterium]